MYLRLWEQTRPHESHLGDGLIIAAGLSLCMGVYCFFLPATPPARNSQNPLAFLQAFSLLRQRNFAVLLAAAFIIAAMSPFAHNFAFIFFTDDISGPGLAPSATSWVLSLGQMLEIPILPFLGVWIARLGMKQVLLLGAFAQVLRFGILALGQPLWLLVLAQGLNALFIVCFIIAASVAVERLSPADLRASAQSLLVLCLRGLGPLCGHLLSGPVYDYFVADGGREWAWIFFLPALATLVGVLVLAALFREEPR